MADPDLVNDGAKFFPNVLRSPVFQKQGILFGQNQGGDPSGMFHGIVPWAVIDPRRHLLYVWEKHVPLFPDWGVKLGSSVFTNGSFNVYKGGNTLTQRAAAWLMVNVYSKVGGAFISAVGLKADLTMEMKNALYTSEESEGFVIGNRHGIVQNKPSESRPTMHHFGRKTGRYFEDYYIAVGDPPAAAEWIGGLFRTLQAYKFGESADQDNTFGVWGLAPMDLKDSDLNSAGLEGALEEYAQKEPTPAQPLPNCTGLLITAFWSGLLSKFATVLGNARVKEAARIDGSDSVVMGSRGNLIFDGETEKKKLYNRWGFACLLG